MTHFKLPHKPPLIFINSMIEKKNDKEIVFNASFPYIPTLSMFCEVAAQGISLFDLSSQSKIGVVTSFKKVKLLTNPTSKDAIIVLEILYSLQDLYSVGFKAYSLSEEIIASGEISIFVSTN